MSNNEEMCYACINCADPIVSSGMCTTCSRAYEIGREEAKADYNLTTTDPSDIDYLRSEIKRAYKDKLNSDSARGWNTALQFLAASLDMRTASKQQT